MDKNILKALYIILTSLGLGLLFNFLFFEKQPGISVFIFSGILLAAVYWFAKKEQLKTKKTLWIGSLILFFALMPTVRANDFLTFLNVCAVLGLLLILANELVGMPAFLMKFKDYAVLLVMVPFRMLARALSSLSLFSQIHSNVKNRDVWVRILKGLIMAIPVLIIFGLLFQSADLAFAKFLDGFINISISEHSIQYLALLLFAFTCALSFLSYIFFPKTYAYPLPLLPQNPEAETEPGSARAEQDGKGKTLEVMVFLIVIASLFLLFIGFQITYLFGGDSNIVNTGFTYAEYARRGFWELLTVAFLTLVVLLLLEKYANTETKKDNKFSIPALALVAEVLVVIVSAFKRLSLYIDTYSMTTLRFYVAGFIILLFAIFLLLAVKFLQSRQENFFTFGSLLLVCAFLVCVNIINPDAFIIRSNINQYTKTGKVDFYYLSGLSADATPSKIELYQKLDGENKQTLKDALMSQKNILEKHYTTWQSYNTARFKALKLLTEVK